MLSSIFSFHTYLVLNIAIATGYLVSQLVLKFSGPSLLQNQRLKFLKYVFLLTLILFFSLPPFLDSLNANYSLHQIFQLQPIVHDATTSFLIKHETISNPLGTLPSVKLFFSMSYLLALIILLGCLIFLIRYLRNILVLKQLSKSGFCQRILKRVHIIFNSTISVPCCWSFIRNHYVVIPITFLENSTDLNLAIRHELQHIRQGDTRWLHFLALMKILCFWNPFLSWWMNLFNEAQEYSCDEKLVLRKKTSPAIYDQCLLDTATNAVKIDNLPQEVLRIVNYSKQIHLAVLATRINRLFHYKPIKKRLLSQIIIYLTFFLLTSVSAYAFVSDPSNSSLTARYLGTLINKSFPTNTLQVSSHPEVVTELNNIRSSYQAQIFMRSALEHMNQYKSIIQTQLKNNSMPADLIAIPLIESGFKPLPANLNPVKAAGIWQIVPATAQRFGLVINSLRDDRLDTTLTTQAALAYLNLLHSQFNDWKLAAIAYEYGEDQTAKLIHEVGSSDPWVLAHSTKAPPGLKNYLAVLDAAIILIHHPSLIRY